jgi:hypothetical protein
VEKVQPYVYYCIHPADKSWWKAACNPVKCKLAGIGRWLQCRWLWMTGIADKILLEGNINLNNDLGHYFSEDDSIAYISKIIN